MKLKGREVLDIALIDTKDYDVKKTKEGSRNHGKKYNIYTYNGIPFTVNSEHEFAKWREEGILYSATFEQQELEQKDDKGLPLEPKKVLRLLGCTNIRAEIAMAEAESDIDYALNKHKPEMVNNTLLNKLQQPALLATGISK